MSSKYWQETLQVILKQKNKRLIIVGIGHELRGDDAVGIEIIRKLQQDCSHSASVLLLNGGSAPENITGSIRRFAPDNVLLIDAVDMSEAPGSIEIVDWSNVDEVAASTHTLSLCLIADYLYSELNCTVLLLGIQPLQMAFDSTLTHPVQASILTIVEFLQNVLA
jgi:hydrogenase 3 maturation protease